MRHDVTRPRADRRKEMKAETAAGTPTVITVVTTSGESQAEPVGRPKPAKKKKAKKRRA